MSKVNVKGLVWVVILGCMSCYQNPYYDPNKPHHTPEGFRNVPASPHKSFWDVLKWRFNSKKGFPKPPANSLPQIQTDLAKLFSSKENWITWVGHSTSLIQMEGKILLTDPQFSQRSSPVSFAGPKRYMPTPFPIESIPKVDYVLISHDHYDHLDDTSIRKITKLFPEATIFTPLGYKKWLQARGVKKFVELDWWEEYKVDDFVIACVPAKHWTKRTPWDDNRKLWSGWVVAHPKMRFYFAGDTGFEDHFKNIGEKYGPFDLAAIPIGAYEPRWFMKHSHIDPTEAAQAHKMLRSKMSVGIHWGTFVLSDEAYRQPPQDLAAALKEKNIPAEIFTTLQHGETKILSR